MDAIGKPGSLRAALQRSRWMMLPPPPTFIVPLVAGVLLGRLWPAPLVPAALAPFGVWLGVAVLVGSAALLVPPPLMFLLRRTTIVPHALAKRLIVSGPYRVTRNPMYLGLVVLYLGVTLVTNVAWPLLFLPFPLWVLHTKIIPYEEENLARIFGDEYREYQRRVRRWL